MNHFEELRKVQPNGPLMNSQFWVGCPTYWKDPVHNKLDMEVIQDDLAYMISKGIGFNLHMFHGGTNFGLSAGLKKEGKYSLTSYDFDAPISESGDLTLKYSQIQKLLSEIGSEFEEKADEEKKEEIARIMEEVEPPELKEKGEYGKVVLTPVDSLLNSQMSCCLKSCLSLFPKSMEEMNLRDGLMAYTTVLKEGAEKNSELRGTVRDRAYVILNNTETIGVMENGGVLNLPMPLEEKSKLTFLVENLGRRPYKSGRTVTKGLFNMYLNGSLLDNWIITTFSIRNPTSVLKLQNNLREKMRKARRTKVEEQPFIDPFTTSGQTASKKMEAIVPPAFYIGSFTLPSVSDNQEENTNQEKSHELDLESEISYEDLGDTFDDSYLNMKGWKKGIVYLNSFCLGRYWDVGPQRTLFVPGSVLLPYPWKNKITVLELEMAPAAESLNVEFVTTPEPELSDVSDEPVSVGQVSQVQSGEKPGTGTGGETEAGKASSGTESGKASSGTEAGKASSGTEEGKVPSGTEKEESKTKVDS